jgi:predicted transposase YbfD/YdcC
VEVRKIWCDIDHADYVRKRLHVLGCQILIRVDREVFLSDGTRESHESRYFISSLDSGEVTPMEVLRFIRNHWEVENCLHWVKDRYLDDDRHYLRRGRQVFAKLSNMALALAKLMQQSVEALVEVTENAHYAPKKILKKLGFCPM